MLQLLFITDAQRRRIHSTSHETKKPGRQVVTFLLLCNITMWIVYTFEVQKVKDSPVQVGSGNVNKDILTAVDFGAIFFQLKFFGFYAWSMIQRVCLPLCIFFRFHSSVILVEIWKNSYKTKLMDWTPKSRISICNKPIYPQAINVHFLKTNQILHSHHCIIPY